jgi:hypothetical protein
MAASDPGYAVLEDMIRRLEQLPATLVAEALPDVARVLETETERTVAAGTDAYGKPWAPTANGELPLQGTPSALRVGVVGDTAVIRVGGHHARHHKGFVRGGKRRGILPVVTLPPRMANAIRRVLEQRFTKHMGGARG